MFLLPVKFRPEMFKKNVLNFELADHTVKLCHFGIVVNFFLRALAEKFGGVINHFMLPAGDLDRMDFVLAGKL